MTDRASPSTFAVAIAVWVTPWLNSLAPAQDYPPPPPIPVQLVQTPAPEPTPIGPVLPGLALPQQAPHPDELPPADPSMAVPEGDVEAFARGPVHEAFADVYELDPTTSEIVAVAPPAVVDELPPDQAPTGENVQWISGYWSWDIEAKDYLWVSGVWRDVPPGRRWVPGYWAEVTGGFQWVGGFWADAQAPDLTYVPPPPESLEVGPNIPPPSDDQQWVPGNWTYVSNDYRWSPGYYTPCQQDYMWIPNQYTWTPRGCVYVPGYWDYRFSRRGTLFTPVRFRRSLAGYGFGRPACYRPCHSVNMSGFLIHLFVRPRCRTYYYGDYYGNQYASIGFTPWYRRSIVHHRTYDPACNFYRMDSRRQGLDFDRNVNLWHQRFESNHDIRPPRLIRDQDQFLTRHHGDRSAQLAVMTHRFDEVVKHPQSGVAFHTMERKDMELLRENNRVTRDLVTARQHMERDSHVVRSGDLKPGEVVDLRLKDARDRTGRESPRGDRGPEAQGRPELPGKLVLTEQPERLKEKSRESMAISDRIRHRSESSINRLPTAGNATSPIGDQAADRVKERTQARDQAGLERQRNEAARSGKTELSTPPSIDDGSKPVVSDRDKDRPDRTGAPNRVETRGAVTDPGSGAARMEELRQKIEERRLSREAGPKPPNGNEVNKDAPVTRNPRIIDGGPLVRPDSQPKADDKPARGLDDYAARQRIEEIRQKAEERRTIRDVESAVPRSVPNAGELRQPRSIDRAPKIDSGVVREPITRERDMLRRIENPPSIERQPQIERAPRIERAPVERAPRQIEQRAPVERQPPMERRAPVERQVPAARESRAPRAERAPAQREEPARRRGKD